MRSTLYKISFSVFIIVFIMLSCSRKIKYEELEITKIPTIHNLSGTLLTFNDSIYWPEKILIAGNYLVIFDDKNTEFLRIFDVYGNLVRKYGRRGKGPGEYILPGSNDLHFSQYNDRKGFWITEINKSVKYFLDFDSLIINENYLPKKNIPLLPELLITSQSYVINDSLIIGSSNSIENGQLFFWNPSLLTFEKVTNYPKTDIRITASQEYLLPQIYHQKIKVHNSNIVVAYYYFKIIDIYTTDGNLIKRIRFSDQNESKIQISDRGISTVECEVYFIDLVMTHNNIYALCLNSTLEEIETGDFFPSIYIFDYNGNLKSELKLDHKINSFSVSEKDSVIYGLSPLTDITKPVVKYELTGLNI